MKAFFRILTGVIVLALSACTPQEQVPDGLTVDLKALTFPVDGGSRSVVVRSGENWDVSRLPDWLSKPSITPSAASQYEKTAEFFAAANEKYDREGVIVIQTPTKTAEITVSQPGKKGVYKAVETISLNRTELTLTEGETATLEWTIQPADASNQTVAWKSSVQTVASVDAQGIVTALAAGTAVVNVTTEDGNKTSTCEVTVKERVIAATGVRLNKSDLTMRLGDEFQLIATVMPENATNQEVVWSSLNPEIVSVSSSGLLTAKAYGETRIVVEAVDGGHRYECIVRVVRTLEDAEISISATSLSLMLGEEATLGIAIQDKNSFTIFWMVSTSPVTPGKILELSPADPSVYDPELTVALKALQPGAVTVTCRVGDRFGAYRDLTCSVTVDMPAPPASIAVPEAIDLGLSVRWASFNLGATAPEGYGDFYAWGETEPYYNPNPFSWKEGLMGYSESSYKWYPKSSTTFPPQMIKYGSDGKTVLDPEDDAAAVNLGGKWRMPTEAEVTELVKTCTWEWTSVNGVNGCKVTGPNGNNIFLPASGHYNGTTLSLLGKLGQYWSSSLAPDDATRASGLDFESGFAGKYNNERQVGLPIRPVTD
ncbi:MAG: Ig-like domain-containing protein [Bacteroidales bacterium]|nr:Ig-like domain-containing protein [Bacteroidales bacterium]